MKRLLLICLALAGVTLLSFGMAGCSSLPSNAENVSPWQ